MSVFLFKRSLTAGLMLSVLTAAAHAAPSDAELTAFGKKVAKTIDDQDAAAYGAVWNRDALVERVTKGVDAPADLKTGFVQGMSSSLAKQLPENFIITAGTSGGMRFIGLRTVDGQARPVLRVNGTNGLNYHELIVEPNAAGELKLVDMFVYTTGENFSQTLRRIYLQSALQLGKNANAMPPGLEGMLKMQAQVKAGDFAGALATYDALPPEAKKQRIIQLQRVGAAAKGDQATYAKVLDEYLTTFKGDASADMIALDSLYMKKEWPAFLASIDRLEKQVGHDPFLDVYRANAAIGQGDTATAKKIATKALAEEPSIFELADVLLTQAIADKDYPAVKVYALHIEQNCPRFRFGDLKNAPGWEGFVASPQYAEWEKERPVK